MKTYFKIFTSVLASAVVLSFYSCSKGGDETTPIATLSIVNTIESSAAQDVYLNQYQIGTVAYGRTLTDFNITVGDKNIAFNNTGTGNTTAMALISTSAYNSTSVFLIKKADGDYDIATFANNNTAINDKAKVRFINVAPQLIGTVNVTTNTGAPIITALTYRTISAYQAVDAGTALNVNITGSSEITTIGNTELKAGKIYTVWFDSSTSTKVKYHVIVEN